MNAVRRLWSRLLLRGVTHRDRFGRLKLLYVLRDPWSLDSPREHHRFVETNRLLSGAFGRVGSLLEMGCGEGLQTGYLKQCCDRLYGIDVSQLAVQRAAKLHPDCEFAAGTLDSVADRFTRSPVDLVAACEVLYYCEDVPANLEIMRRIAGACFVTCYQSRTDRVFPHLEAIPGAEFATIRYEEHTWRACWWRNAGAAGAAGPSHAK